MFINITHSTLGKTSMLFSIIMIFKQVNERVLCPEEEKVYMIVLI